MRRLALVLLVAVLTFSTSGAFALIAPEPCGASAQAGPQDDACPPTCPTCGCCAQGVEPVSLPVAATPGDPLADMTPLAPRLSTTAPRDILHVPKARVA